MIVAGQCMRCMRKVHALEGIRTQVHRAMVSATREAEVEILRGVYVDLLCHLEKCERPPRRVEVDHAV